MPYVRSITFSFFFASLILPVLGKTYPSDFVTYVILFALFVWLLALLNDFLSSLIALILSAFVTQRMLILYLDPTAFEYEWVTVSQITVSTLFCLLAVLGIFLGSLIFNLLYSSKKPKEPNHTTHYQTFNTFLGSVKTSNFLYISSFIIIFGILINLYFAFNFGIGVGSELADRSDIGSNLSFIEKIFTRLGPFFTYLMMFVLVVLVDDNFPKKTR